MKIYQVHKHNRATLFIVITFTLTLLFHFILRFVSQPQSYLGIAMLLPAIALLIMRFIVPVSFASIGITKTFNVWFLVSIVMPIVIVIIIYSLIILITGNPIKLVNSSVLASIFQYTLIGISIAAISALFEEVGWRGYLQLELEGSGYLRASIIVGVVWAVWHVPTALIYLRFNTPFWGISTYILQLFLISLQISYVRLRAKNVLAAALMHGMVNALFFNPLLFPEQLVAYNVELLKIVALSITLTCFFIYDWLARESLFVGISKK